MSVSKRHTLLATLVACGGLLWAHGSRIATNLQGPQWEDRLFFQYTREHVHSLLDCFVHTGPYPGLYRPLTTNLYYFIGLRLFGDSVVPYHLINVALIVLNAALLYRIAFRLMPGWIALLAPLLFASRLANVEVVLHTCEFQGLFSATWALLSVDLFIQKRYRWSTGAFALAVLSKETAAVVPAILLVYRLAVDRGIPGRAFLGQFLILLGWMAAMTLLPRDATGFGYDYSLGNVLHNLSAYLLTFSNFLLSPFGDYVMPGNVDQLAKLWSVRAGVAGLIALDVVAILATERFRLIAFGFAWFVLATLPATAFQGRLFMRYGYFGYAGLSIVMCAALELAANFVLKLRRPTAAIELQAEELRSAANS